MECKICGSGSRSRASSSFPLSLFLFLFLLRSLSHLFCPSFCFSNFTLSALFTYTTHLSISSPSILLHLFFFYSSLKSDFNGSCRGYYTSSVILLREIFIRGKGIRRRFSSFDSRSDFHDSSSFNVFINSYVCLIVFSRIIPPYYFPLDNNWNALIVSESRKGGVGGLGLTFRFGRPIVWTLVPQNLFPGF